jgi:hypothetical protein
VSASAFLSHYYLRVSLSYLSSYLLVSISSQPSQLSSCHPLQSDQFSSAIMLETQPFLTIFYTPQVSCDAISTYGRHLLVLKLQILRYSTFPLQYRKIYTQRLGCVSVLKRWYILTFLFVIVFCNCIRRLILFNYNKCIYYSIMDVVEHLKMWDQFIESKTTLNPSVKESECWKICFRLSNTKNSSRKVRHRPGSRSSLT